MKNLFLLAGITLFLPLSSYAAELQDSVKNSEPKDTASRKTTNLDEVVVTTDWQWRDGEKCVFLPRKRQKNVASDATDLLRQMHLPVLLYAGGPNGTIKGLNGQDISIFINGVAATSIDMKTFWPKQCLRVEYYEHPSDPRFQGATNVVNFIMPVYEWGGLTKVKGYQLFPNNGSYDLASKFTYKRMTYGASFTGGYSRDHISGSEVSSDFYDLYYKASHYDHISSLENRSANASRNDNISGAMNAVYRNGTTVITHQASLNWSRNPGSYESGSLLYNPDIINGSSFLSRSRARSMSPVFSGRYDFKLPKDVYFDGFWRYSHNHNTSYSSYSAGEESPFFNAARENVNSVNGHIFLAKYSGKFGMNGMLESSYDWYSTRYDGTYNNEVRQRRGETAIKTNLFFTFSNRLRAVLSPEVSWTYWTLVGDENRTQFSPGIRANVTYGWNGGKNNSSFSCWYFRINPAASEWTDALVRQSELFWLKGNPNMKVQDSFNLDVAHTTRPLKILDLTLQVGWSRSLHEKGLFYYAAQPEQGGIIKEYYNTSGKSTLHFRVNPSLNLMDGNLSVYAQITGMRTDIFGKYRDHLFWMRYQGGASFYFGNFGIDGYISSKQKGLYTDGHKDVFPVNYGLTLRYGNGNLTFSFDTSEFLHRTKTIRNWMDVGCYSVNERNWLVGRNFNVRVTYTFDYGKKLKDRSTINAESDSKTSVLGAE